MPPFVTQQPSGSGQAGVHFVGWLDVASRPPFSVPRCQTRVGRYKLVWWTLFLCTHALGSTLMPHKIKRDSPPVSTHARHPDPGSACLCYTSSCRLCLSLSLSLALSPSLSDDSLHRTAPKGYADRVLSSQRTMRVVSPAAGRISLGGRRTSCTAPLRTRSNRDRG